MRGLEFTVNRLEHSVASLEKEIKKMILRNHEKDRGKEFEGSYTRVAFIMILTYFTLFGYMRLIGTENAALNAIVPTLGFNISTWSIPFVKEAWISFKDRTTSGLDTTRPTSDPFDTNLYDGVDVQQANLSIVPNNTNQV